MLESTILIICHILKFKEISFLKDAFDIFAEDQEAFNKIVYAVKYNIAEARFVKFKFDKCKNPTSFSLSFHFFIFSKCF